MTRNRSDGSVLRGVFPSLPCKTMMEGSALVNFHASMSPFSIGVGLMEGSALVNFHASMEDGSRSSPLKGVIPFLPRDMGRCKQEVGSLSPPTSSHPPAMHITKPTIE
jgi:hypothetical protein